jgi:hypothetical protein
MSVRRLHIAIVSLAFAAPAQAVTVDVHATITRGDLSTIFPPASVTLPVIDLDGGGDQQVFIDLPFTVDDSRGNGAGWGLSVASNGFTQASAPMPGTSARFTGATASCSPGQACTLPDTSVVYPVALAANVPAVRFFNAGTGTGMGQTDVSARFAVTVPGSAYAGDFETTLTLTQSAGP